MKTRRLGTIVIVSIGVAIGSLSQIGCSDESKTTGTQLKLTPKDLAEIEGMRDAMKGQRAAQKSEKKRQ